MTTTHTTASSGLAQISAAFSAALARQSAALMPYFTLGYPDIESSLDIVAAIAANSDLLELGIPFSDPLADGPTIQHSTQVALENGTTVAKCLAMVGQLRQRGISTPACLMGYYNPILAYGPQRFVDDAAQAGVQGFIVPDLPPEEASEFAEAAAQAGLAYIYFLAPTSSPERIEQVCQRASGFIYLVSLTGVTGARQTIQTNLESFIKRVRTHTDLPLAVGFGISTPEQAASVGELADGIIIGSALVSAVGEAVDKTTAASAFTAAVQKALRQ